MVSQITELLVVLRPNRSPMVKKPWNAENIKNNCGLVLEKLNREVFTKIKIKNRVISKLFLKN